MVGARIRTAKDRLFFAGLEIGDWGGGGEASRTAERWVGVATAVMEERRV